MKTDAVIVGAGPAGLSAAIRLAKENVAVIVIDEYYRPGGRLLGQLYEDPSLPDGEKKWNGKEIANNLALEARKPWRANFYKYGRLVGEKRLGSGNYRCRERDHQRESCVACNRVDGESNAGSWLDAARGIYDRCCPNVYQFASSPNRKEGADCRY